MLCDCRHVVSTFNKHRPHRFEISTASRLAAHIVVKLARGAQSRALRSALLTRLRRHREYVRPEQRVRAERGRDLARSRAISRDLGRTSSKVLRPFYISRDLARSRPHLVEGAQTILYLARSRAISAAPRRGCSDHSISRAISRDHGRTSSKVLRPSLLSIVSGAVPDPHTDMQNHPWRAPASQHLTRASAPAFGYRTLACSP